jgi:hypothetical protein
MDSLSMSQVAESKTGKGMGGRSARYKVRVAVEAVWSSGAGSRSGILSIENQSVL